MLKFRIVTEIREGVMAVVDKRIAEAEKRHAERVKIVDAEHRQTIRLAAENAELQKKESVQSEIAKVLITL